MADLVGAPSQRLRCTGLLAWAAWLDGRRDRALELAERAERLFADVRVPPGRSYLFGAHAYVAVARVLAGAGQPGASLVKRGGGGRVARVGGEELIDQGQTLCGPRWSHLLDPSC